MIKFFEVSTHAICAQQYSYTLYMYIVAMNGPTMTKE